MKWKNTYFQIFTSIILILLASNATSGFQAQASSNLQTCSCGQISDKLYVTNTDTYSDAYNIKQNLDFVDIAPKNFILTPGETAELVMLINPTCGSYGTYELKTTITSLSGKQKFLVQKLNVVNCRDFQAKIDSPVSGICGNFQQNLTIFNTELEDEEREYTVTGTGIPQTKITIAKGKQQGLALRPAMKCNFENTRAFFTEYNITNNIITKTIRKRVKIFPERKAFELQISPDKFNIHYETKEIEIRLKHTGEFASGYTLRQVTVNASDEQVNLIRLKNKSVVLGPGQEQKVKLPVNPENFRPGNYILYFSATAGNTLFGKQITIKLSKSFSQRVRELWSSYVVPNKWFWLILLLSLLLLFLLIRALNVYNKKKKEKLLDEFVRGRNQAEVEGKKASYDFKEIIAGKPNEMVINSLDIPITKIIVFSNKKLKGVSLRVIRDDSLPSKYQGNTYQGVKIYRSNLNDRDVEKIIVRFRVKKRSHKLKTNEVYLSRYRKKWDHYKAKKKGETKNYLYYEAEVPGLSYFTIGNRIPDVVKPKIKKPRKPINWRGWLLLFVLFLILLLAAAAIYHDMYIKEKQPENVRDMIEFIDQNDLWGSFNYLVMSKNSELDFRLSKHFTDPDNDPLNYEVVLHPQNITITINKDIAHIKPDKDFTGVRKTVFFASDGVDYAISDEVFIVVKD